MNVASTAGFQPGPLMAVYYATKAYVISFSEALANELADKGITVTCLCPGATETGFAGRAGNDATRLFKNLRPMDAKTVARVGYRGLLKGKTLVIPGFRNWLVAESIRVSPRKIGDGSFALDFGKSGIKNGGRASRPARTPTRERPSYASKISRGAASEAKREAT